MPRAPRGLEQKGPEQIDIRQRQVSWPQAWRIVASRYPPINLFERLSADPRVWEALIELEQRTNPRIRDEAGEISLVPPGRRVTGPNASWVMAPFTHLNVKGSRFSNGAYGVYYAARDLPTAIRETAFHFGRFAADSNDPPRREDMRVFAGSADHLFDDVESVEEPARNAILDKGSYAFSQPFGAVRRRNNSDGLVYPSVRHEGGHCIAAFWPDVIGVPVQERHLQYEWDGTTVRRYFDFRDDTWNVL